jgi:hypothetical protein
MEAERVDARRGRAMLQRGIAMQKAPYDDHQNHESGASGWPGTIDDTFLHLIHTDEEVQDLVASSKLNAE